ncbi:MAG TPA: hypothetical protein VLT86_13555 [Vicinamibacterales bacterium]|nr:hypothetical protein [Vicinamibacterales bacterium]
MRRAVIVSGIVSLAIGPPALSARQAKPAMTLTKAGLAATVNNNQKQALAPAAGETFLWVSATASAAETLDLTRIAVVDGPSSSPLLGVDSTWDGDPKAFSMIAPVHLQAGNTLQAPMEQSSSDGSSAFAFTPGKGATLKISKPPVSFCLVFAVPRGFRSGQVKGLGAANLPLPALAAGR